MTYAEEILRQVEAAPMRPRCQPLRPSALARLTGRGPSQRRRLKPYPPSSTRGERAYRSRAAPRSNLDRN